MAKPSPKAINVVCSECGLSWEKHTAGRKTAPTADVCIRLLKAELAARPRFSSNNYPQTASNATSNLTARGIWIDTNGAQS